VSRPHIKLGMDVTSLQTNRDAECCMLDAKQGSGQMCGVASNNGPKQGSSCGWPPGNQNWPDNQTFSQLELFQLQHHMNSTLQHMQQCFLCNDV